MALSRNTPSVTKRSMTLSDLNDDVIFEVFLNFVAIDWDGPFTLMLVCTKWSSIVISKPRLWTWVMVDDTLADWKERVDTCAYLSKTLPLQIVLRAPFSSNVSMAYLTHRCTTIIIECPCVYRDNSLTPWPSVSFISYEDFRPYRTDLKDLTDSIISFLKDAPIEKMRILSGDKDRAAFAYSMWSIYEETMVGQPVNSLLIRNLSTPITDLRFKRPKLSSVVIQLSELWAIIPLLSHLTFLEVSESIIKWNQDETLPQISLKRLEILVIDSPTNKSGLYSFEFDILLGLFGVLDNLSAPNLETLILCGSIHRILGLMIKESTRVRPYKLITDISASDDTLDAPFLDVNPVWCNVRSLTACLTYFEKVSSHVAAHRGTMEVDAVLSLLPQAGSMQICDRKEEIEVAPLLTLDFAHFTEPAAGILSSQQSFVFRHTKNSVSLLFE